MPQVKLQDEILARSAGRTQPHSVTFEVSDHFLETGRLEQWSEPVAFRFEESEHGWDLVMRRVDGEG